MSTSISFRFVLGRYHGTRWGHNVNEGAVDWPPEPWRIVRALVATWKTRLEGLDRQAVESTLAKLADPPVYEVPPYALAHTRHYMPDNKDGTDKVIDAFAAIDRDAPLVVTWPADLNDPERAVLRQLCDELPYLGRAESICEARLLERDHSSSADSSSARPLTEGDAVRDPVRMLVPASPLDLGAITVRTADMRKAGHLDPPGSVRVAYECPPAALPTANSPRHRRVAVTAIRWSIISNARPSVKSAVVMADALRAGAMSRFGTPPSPVLAGKDDSGSPLAGHRHAHYLALPNLAGESDRLLSTLVIWAPRGIGDAEQEALGRLESLSGREFVADFRPCRLGLEAFGAIEDVAPELCGPAESWESLTPFAPPRHSRKNEDWYEFTAAELQRELQYAGKPVARSIEVTRGDWLDFRRHRIRERRAVDARRAIGARLYFDEQVSGPICLGALSHFGLGLFVPVRRLYST
jgi:CRISPR-associated protein Csb2